MNLLVPLPKEILVCCSGGVDSISAAHWLARKHKVSLYFFDHGTPLSPNMEKGVTRFSKDHKLDLIVHRTDKDLKSEGEFRTERIKFLVNGNFNACTAHHIGDATESYIQNMCVGRMDKIPIPVISQLGGSIVYHPFLLTDKEQFKQYCARKDLYKYVTEDVTNHDPNYCRRNWIRNVMIPQFTEKQIGLKTIVRKRYLKWKQEYGNSNSKLGSVLEPGVGAV